MLVSIKDSWRSFNHKWAFVCLLLFELAFSLYWYSVAESKLLLVGTVVLGLPAVAIAFFMFFDASPSFKKQIGLFAGVLTISGLVAVFASTPFSVPDEFHHYMSSYWLSDVTMGSASITDGKNFKVDYDDWKFFCESDSEMSVISEENYKEVLDLMDDSNGSVQKLKVIQNTYSFKFASENVVAKVGSVIGLTVGRLLNLNPLWTFYSGRIGSVLMFVALMVLAYKKMPFAKNAVVVVALLPMSLHLAASYSYDSGIIAIATLAVALFLNAIYSKEAITKGEIVALCVCGGALVTCKVIYSAILLGVFFIPNERFSSKKKAYLFKFGLLFIGLLSFVLVRLPSFATVRISSEETSELNYRGSESGYMYSVSDIIQYPFRTAAMFVRTFISQWDWWLGTMIGYSLGWFQGNLVFNSYTAYIYVAIAILAMLKTETDSFTAPVKLRVFLLFCMVASVLGAMLSMYLGWTFNTEDVIRGVQGRYFLPLLAAALVAFRVESISFPKMPALFALSSISMINIFYIIRFVSMAMAG